MCNEELLFLISESVPEKLCTISSAPIKSMLILWNISWTNLTKYLVFYQRINLAILSHPSRLGYSIDETNSLVYTSLCMAMHPAFTLYMQ